MGGGNIQIWGCFAFSGVEHLHRTKEKVISHLIPYKMKVTVNMLKVFYVLKLFNSKLNQIKLDSGYGEL